MISIANLLRNTAVAALSATTVVLPTSGVVASASPADYATVAVSSAPALTLASKAYMAEACKAVCVNAHVQNIGWQGWRCGRSGWPVEVGTTGQALRVEALAISTR